METPSTPANQLKRFSVTGLFGEFTHNIPLNTSERITAVIAPNGTGITVCLRMISSLFRKNWAFFRSVTFDFAEYHFTGGQRVIVHQTHSETEQEKAEAKPQITIEVSTPELEVPFRIWEPRIATDLPVSLIENTLGFLTRVGSTKWIHDYTGETYSLSEVIDTFGDQLPERIMRTAYRDLPQELADLLSTIDCHLIETQRLLVLHDEEDVRMRQYRGRLITKLAINQKAKALSQLIAQTLQQYAALSQALDSTFPQRVIAASNILSAEDVKRNIRDLENKRSLLTDAGILDNEGTSESLLPSGKEDDAILRVLSVYTEDTSKKLGYLSSLLDRIQLFRELAASRFQKKQIVIDRKTGIRVKYGNSEVALDKLSSGEQHQLVLFFELLFEIKKNSLILIDEPELSLHVAWQAKFIDDLKLIIKLNDFDVILATHSPQLIGNHIDLMVELDSD